MDEENVQFPTWMVVPPTLRLFTEHIHENLPAIQELWVDHRCNWGEFSSRCPTLQVLRSNSDELERDLLDFLRVWKKDVEIGFEVGFVKVEPLKKLVIHFNKLSAEALEECRELVEEVVDWDSERKTWEVEI